MDKEIVIREQKRHKVGADIDEQIAEQVDVARGLQERIAALDYRLQTIKEEIRTLLDEKGSNWSDAEGYARIISEGTRTSYETKGLDDLILKDPLHYGWLKDYRKESAVRGGIQIK